MPSIDFGGNFWVAGSSSLETGDFSGQSEATTINFASNLRGLTMLKEIGVFRTAVLRAGLMLVPVVTLACGAGLKAQGPAPVAAARQLGTVTAVAGNSLTLKTDAGQGVPASGADGVGIVQLAPGSTDLKTAETIALKDIAVGDRVPVSGKARE